MVLGTFDHRFLKLFHMGKTHITMALHIGLRQYINSIFIAQLIKIWIIRIMGSADCIDIQPLHQTNIIFHFFPGDRTTIDLTMVMPVHTMKYHPLPVDQ